MPKIFSIVDVTAAIQIIEVKAFKSKAQERQEIEQQTHLFLKRGGKVVPVDRGVSGETIENRKMPATTFSGGEKSERTPLTDEIKAIEARRQSMRQSKKLAKPKRGPRRILIRDDFGEPLRWSWKDD